MWFYLIRVAHCANVPLFHRSRWWWTWTAGSSSSRSTSAVTSCTRRRRRKRRVRRCRRIRNPEPSPLGRSSACRTLCFPLPALLTHRALTTKALHCSWYIHGLSILLCISEGQKLSRPKLVIPYFFNSYLCSSSSDGSHSVLGKRYALISLGENWAKLEIGGLCEHLRSLPVGFGAHVIGRVGFVLVFGFFNN